jgi:anti-sigma B factor antagonist
MSGLIVRVGGSDGRRTLTPAGELDMATARELESALDNVWRDGITDLLLDLRELEFIDSTGVRLMIEVVKCCQASGCQLEVTRGVDGVQRIFDLCGLEDAVPFRNGHGGAGQRPSRDGATPVADACGSLLPDAPFVSEKDLATALPRISAEPTVM